jgi:galactose oxidase-like protein
VINRNIRLRIVRPRDGLYYGLVSSKAVLKIKIQAFISQTRIDDIKFLPLLEGWAVGIMLDGIMVATADHVKEIKATYATTIDLRKLSDGTHTLQAVIQQKGSASRPQLISDSDPVNFIIDRNPPSISSVFPSNGIKIEERFFSRMLVEASGGLTGLYLKRCTVVIDKQIYRNPVEHKKGLVFSVPTPPARGIHKLKLTVFDKAGNKATRQSIFEILESTAQVEEQYWQERKSAVEEKLTSDIRFRKMLLSDARGAFAEAGIPYTKVVSSVLPPPLPQEHADFFAGVDSEKASQTLEPLKQRIIEALSNRDNARIAKILEGLGLTGIVPQDGGLTANEKNSISRILQDPYGMMASLGVTATEEEKQFLFPPFPKGIADAFAEWMSMTQAGKPSQPSAERQNRLQEISKRVGSDPTLLFNWLTKPEKSFKEAYPDATARDLVFLPPPMPEDEAKRIIDSLPPSPSPASQNISHNSSDVVVGISFSLMNKVFDLYFNTLQPRIFPQTFTFDSSTGLPPPYANIRSEINIAQPGNLRVQDAIKSLVSATGSGSVGVTLDDNTHYEYALSLTPVYSIMLKDNKVFLDFDSIGVQVNSIGSEMPAPHPDASLAIKNALEDEVRKRYPRIEIYIMDQKPMDINIPFADVAVDLHRIRVQDDQDPYSDGELYFGIRVDDKEYLFGQFDVESGSSIELNRRYLLSKGASGFPIQVRGIDMDFDDWPDQDDYLGDAINFHTRLGPGTYALIGQTPHIYLEVVWDILDFVLRVFCWIVEVLFAIVNACLALLGFSTRLESRCNTWREAVMGWVTRALSVMRPNYTFEYSISQLNPVAISASLSECHIVNDVLYLSVDFSIPNIQDKLVKTEAIGFVGSSDLGIAVSENVLNKIVRAWWTYSPITQTMTTNYDNRLYYVHLDIDQPELSLQPSLVSLALAMSGTAGINVSSAHKSLAVPNGALASISLSLQSQQLVFSIDKISLLGDSPLNALEDLLTAWSHKFIPPIVMDLSRGLRFGVNNADFNLKRSEPIKINNDEIVINLSSTLAPAIHIEPSQLDFSLDSNPKTITVKNVGDITLTIERLTCDNNVFSLGSPIVPFNVLPNNSVVLTVSINPAWTRQQIGTVSIQSNDPGQPTSIVQVIALVIPPGSMGDARAYHTATLLPNGKVLVAGGTNQNGVLASAELYDPATHAWTPTGSLINARSGHTATLLPDEGDSGLVLVVGGAGVGALTEVYNCTNGNWETTGSLVKGSWIGSGHAAALLPNDQVLVAGGEFAWGGRGRDGPEGGISPDSHAELYAPNTGIWTALSPLYQAHQFHTATLVDNGRALIVGGVDVNGTPSIHTEVFYLDQFGFYPTVSLGQPRQSHTATLLNDGKVLIVGGDNQHGSLASATLFRFAAEGEQLQGDGEWNDTGSMSTPRANHTAILLSDGRVLVVGGGPLSVELYDPTTGAWTTNGSLQETRGGNTATLLPDGRVLVVGGTNNTGYLATTELYVVADSN